MKVSEKPGRWIGIGLEEVKMPVWSLVGEGMRCGCGDFEESQPGRVMEISGR